ncbi:MAG: acyl-ACP--UDP-N-acetylglucosamine O-acyltransferase [Gloeomargaritaceae cyanobacterium C42_A2020_066]|nr:acyl-ACP--UDP-N-acetylglucosamine O-acyltransferase [Gloeomargaritaceae cyanobacterium C42_A2020_066]
MTSVTLTHPTAVIHPAAQLHPTVQVGPYAVIGERVRIGPETVIGAHVVIDGHTEIGARNRIFPGAVIGLEPQDLKYAGLPTRVVIGDDNLIREYVTINRATGEAGVTRIGNQTLLMAYAHIAHDCCIEDQVIIANSVALAGHVYVETQARISGVLGVHQFVRIGRLAMVGGMARIDRDVPPFMLVEGNPARIRFLNRVGLQRAGLGQGPVSQGLKQAYRLLYRSSLTFQEALDALTPLAAEHEPVHHLREFLIQSQTAGRRGPTPGPRRSMDRRDAEATD